MDIASGMILCFLFQVRTVYTVKQKVFVLHISHQESKSIKVKCDIFIENVNRLQLLKKDAWNLLQH